jgi:hypothetical protein
VTKLNKKKYLAIITMAISAIFLTSLAYAEVSQTVNIYAWTDKTSYNPGEKGRLTIVIRNDRTDEDLILNNITILYPWFAYTGEKWEGNDTITPSPPFVLSKNAGNIYKNTVEFTVPSDGRAIGGVFVPSLQIDIKIAVDKSPYQYTKTAPFYIKSTPWYTSLEDMDKIVALFTIQAVLLIICTIIIAATIFLSVRRPRVTWKKEAAEG